MTNPPERFQPREDEIEPLDGGHVTFDMHLDDLSEPLPPPKPLKWGDLCPQCGKGKLDYNCLLYLECPVCGYEATGGAGCT